jgi:hypothetical protein
MRICETVENPFVIAEMTLVTGVTEGNPFVIAEKIFNLVG